MNAELMQNMPVGMLRINMMIPYRNRCNIDVDLSVMLKLQNRAFKLKSRFTPILTVGVQINPYYTTRWILVCSHNSCRDKMIELNNTINWKPQSTGTDVCNGLEFAGLNLSRSRYWGTPLPLHRRW